MSNYTEADVMMDAMTVGGALSLLDHDDVGQRTEGRSALSRLKAAALEGAKVPGLVADLAQRTRERDSEMEERWKASEVKRQQTERAEAADAKVSALQARVKELEQAVLARAEAHKRTSLSRRAAECERDALRAQVTQAVAIASGVATRMPDDVAGIVCRDILAALSATSAEASCGPCADHECAVHVHATCEHCPPAETPAKEAEAEEHARLDRLGVPTHGRCLATNKRESLTLEERRELAPPPETTPAPERAESKRSCNLHSDCDAADARARASGHPNGDEHCNDSDCSDHQ